MATPKAAPPTPPRRDSTLDSSLTSSLPTADPMERRRDLRKSAREARARGCQLDAQTQQKGDCSGPGEEAVRHGGVVRRRSRPRIRIRFRPPPMPPSGRPRLGPLRTCIGLRCGGGAAAAAAAAAPAGRGRAPKVAVPQAAGIRFGREWRDQGGGPPGGSGRGGFRGAA